MGIVPPSLDRQKDLAQILPHPALTRYAEKQRTNIAPDQIPSLCQAIPCKPRPHAKDAEQDRPECEPNLTPPHPAIISILGPPRRRTKNSAKSSRLDRPPSFSSTPSLHPRRKSHTPSYPTPHPAPSCAPPTPPRPSDSPCSPRAGTAGT